jgi:U2-associated protein SR140
MVAEHGVSFERALAAREHDNPTYNFLRVPSLPDSQYYRWRVYSLARGDSLRRWRSEPFQVPLCGVCVRARAH